MVKKKKKRYIERISKDQRILEERKKKNIYKYIYIYKGSFETG